jgi:hypothetical protein
MKHVRLVSLACAALTLSCAQTSSRKIAGAASSPPLYELRCRNQGTHPLEIIREELKRGAGSPHLVQHTVTFRPISLQNERVETRVGDRPVRVSVAPSQESCILQYSLRTLLDGVTPPTFTARVLSLNLSGGLAFTPYAPAGRSDFLKAEFGARYPQRISQPLGIKKEMRSEGITRNELLKLEAIPRRATQDQSTLSRLLSGTDPGQISATLSLFFKTGAPTQMTYGTDAEPLTLRILAEIEHNPKE